LHLPAAADIVRGELPVELVEGNSPAAASAKAGTTQYRFFIKSG
jgi:hypothetical protein